MTQNLSERGLRGNRSIELADMNDIKIVNFFGTVNFELDYSPNASNSVSNKLYNVWNLE